LSPATPEVTALRALPEPQVLVEHTASGGAAIDLGAGPVSIRSTPLPHEQRSLLGLLPIAISSVVEDEVLTIYVAHDGRIAAAEAEALADHLAAAFAELDGGR
jgi:hypothetical protein